MNGGDETFELIRRFSDRHSEAAARLDALLDLRQVDDPRLTSAVLRALKARRTRIFCRLPPHAVIKAACW